MNSVEALDDGRATPYNDWVLHARRVGPSVGRSVFRHPVVVLSVMLGFGLFGYWLSSQQTEQFTAATRLFLSSSSPFDGVGQVSYVASPDRYAVNQAAIALSSPVLDRAIDTAELDVTVEELRESLAVSAGRGNDVITIEATSDSPVEAAETANAMAEAYRAFKLDEVDRQTEQLTALSTTEEDRASVLKRAAVYGDGIELFEAAIPPTSASYPQPIRDALFALIVGAVLGIGAAVGLDAIQTAWRRRQSRRGASTPSAKRAPTAGQDRDVPPEASVTPQQPAGTDETPSRQEAAVH